MSKSRNFSKSRQNKRTYVDVSPGIFGRGGRKPPRFCFQLKIRCNLPFLHSKSVGYDFPCTEKTIVSKRQKMAIIAAIMVINGNSKMALNSRSIRCQFTTPNRFFKSFFGVFNEFAIRRRSADAKPGQQLFRTAGSEMPPSG